jgi:glyoxylase-like metal-dependent hydrolase (beta-lactamase superfamily II)
MKKHYIKPEKFPIQLKKNIFMLGNYFFNVFLIIGNKKTVLFETGISAVADTIISQIENIGRIPDYIIPAHPHSDHITGLPGLMERFPEATIITAKGAKEFIEHPKARSLLIKEDRFLHQSLSQRGLHPKRKPLEEVPDLNSSLIVDKQKTLDLGNTTIELIKVHGHSPGNLIAFIPELKIIFTSDSLGFHYPGRFFFPLFFTGLNEYLSTIDLIESFEPVMACPAHQGHIAENDIKHALKKTKDATLEIADLIKQGKHSNEELSEKLFNYCYVDEFRLYTEVNIRSCVKLLIKRAREVN